MKAASPSFRSEIVITGVVQGVGFRPYVYGLASRYGLGGFVRNSNGAVIIEVQGAKDSLAAFLAALPAEVPPLASIVQVVVRELEPLAHSSAAFTIEKSIASGAEAKFAPPDSATCADCLAELFDKNDRRYRYPFINCTNCGPRFTIISALPYDRPFTTMQPFSLCDACLSEYENPTDRRFHAQPNACRDCGPTLSFVNGKEELMGEAALKRALEALKSAEIIAVKGLGGFHLMVDALSIDAVQKLRQKKQRLKKPFAVMMSDLEMVAAYCRLSDAEAQQLLHPSRPIVLLYKLPGAKLPEELAPGLDCLGVMLPYTPLHHLLLNDLKGPLVATSANLSDEPIAIDNDEAQTRLAQIAGGFLQHNRTICSRYDDSVVQMLESNTVVLRRSRGLAPSAVPLPFKAQRTALACGAHLKNTFCFVRQDQAYVSHHIGDLESIESEDYFRSALETYMSLFDLSFEVVAHDYHPDYLSTSIAEELAKGAGVPLIPVQHHHAHIVSCMVEAGLQQEVIGVAFDGSGYGPDGTLWGGEFLLTSLRQFRRVAHFKACPLPGGAQAMRQPWRMMLSYIIESAAEDQYAGFLQSLNDQYGDKTIAMVARQIRQRIVAPLTSSCGRLFDAMSALLGVCQSAEYEGQAAMELETCASRAADSKLLHGYCYQIETQADGRMVINPAQILQEAFFDHQNNIDVNVIAANFHRTIANLVLDVCVKIRANSGVNTVCLGGGVFQNRLLLALVLRLLRAHDFAVFAPGLLPANDGGLSLGQAVAALAKNNALVFAADS